ncbi:major surface-labeled trophozoite antigen 417-like isoform X2 [Mytilus californianus]|uniref:major surface-labeled trophozoite antigen 417-like isoform X2 n=1 Tax=Mytilus californianus TaxID=6549 RepID=UPI002247BD15|nr:major surface-labeled trophozoite antigen 417-like isoform X2 [Mytilus californianus]
MIFWITISIAITSISAYGPCPNPPRCAPGCFKLDERGCLLCACGVLNFHPGGYHGMPQLHMGGGGFVPGQMSGGGMFGGHKAQTQAQSKPLSQCPGTKLCMQTCKGKYSLGNVDRNGCKTCTCHTTHVSTHHSSNTVYVAKQQPQQQPKPQPHKTYSYVVQQVQHKEASCTGTKLCMMTCKSRYVLGAKGRDGCNTCTCIPEPTPAPTKAPAKMSCMSTVMCMLTCKNGYQLGATKTDGCQECACVVPQVVKMEVTCASKLTCSSGCNVGYKCGTDGCPTCGCIKPQVVGLKVVEVVQKQVTCTSSFSCPSKCSLGYKCGTDGCPTCECLVAVHTEQKPVIVTEPLKQPSKTETVTLLKQCPATFNCMTSCKEGYTLGSAGRDGCPACTCATVQKQTCNDCHHTSRSCDATISCMATCEHGYILGDKDNTGCPSCQCQACSTCEETKPQVVLVQQQKETCNNCEKVQVVQQVKEECHECETTGLMTGGTSGGGSGGGMTGGSGSGMMGGGGGGAMGGGMSSGGGGSAGMTGGSECHPLPPDCHPSCIKYDVAHCRICECTSNPGHGISYRR